MNRFLAGVGRALLFKGNDLIGVAKTLTESTFEFSITGEDIRGGSGNALWGKYFHDSSLNVTLTDAMFNLEYVAASLGVDIQQGGLCVAEEQITLAAPGSASLTNTAIAFDGTLIGWYKKPNEDTWSIGVITDNAMSIPGSVKDDIYCVKYFYLNPNARSITIPTQYVPSELHVVIINDMFAGDIGALTDNPRVGRLITDIPRLQMDGNQTLNLTATSAATVSLTGSALAVSSGDSCEEEPYYGTMTEEIFGAKWQENVIALAIENADTDLDIDASDTLIVRVVFRGNMAAERKSNEFFTFTTSDASVATVAADTGVVTGKAAGTAYISVALTGYNDVDPAVAKITVAASA